MNKIYSLLGSGRYAATLSSCKEDVFIEGGDELQRGESQTYVGLLLLSGGMKIRTKNRLHVPTYKMTVVPLCGMPMIRLHFGMEQMAMISQP